MPMLLIVAFYSGSWNKKMTFTFDPALSYLSQIIDVGSKLCSSPSLNFLSEVQLFSCYLKTVVLHEVQLVMLPLSMS